MKAVVLVIVAFLLACVVAVFVFWGSILGALGLSGSSGGGTRQSGSYAFRMSVGSLGDRIYLAAPVFVTLTPRPDKPDLISVSPTQGPRTGVFRWTVIPHQGNRGVRRVFADLELGSQTLKMCEAVDDPDNRYGVPSERYLPINNFGSRYTLPIRVEPAPFFNFITAAVAEPGAQVANTNADPSNGLRRLAETLVPLCTGQ